jgi:hypothetical protein
MRIVEQISEKENHFNNLQTGYRKLASTWLLAAFGACGYMLKSGSDISSFDKWYFVFGICIAASLGLSVLWMMDLKVYQKLLGAFFFQGVLLELEYYQWLPPFRINTVRSQKTGEIRSKVQYFYFFSIVILQLLAIISIWNFNINLVSKIIYTVIISSAVLSAQIILLVVNVRRRREFHIQPRKKVKNDGGKPTLGELIYQWELKTGESTSGLV